MRLLAARLLDHAAQIMPAQRRPWLRAMRAELAHIPHPLAAAAFALGCVRASYTERMLEMMIFARLARWALAAYALIGAGCYLLATALVGGVKSARGIRPEDLGSDPGTAETLSFHQGYPVWQLGVFLLIAALFVWGAILLLRRRGAALPMLASGVAAATLIAVLDRRLVGPGADWPLAWSLGWTIPLLCLVPVWWLSRRAPDLQTVR